MNKWLPHSYLVKENLLFLLNNKLGSHEAVQLRGNVPLSIVCLLGSDSRLKKEKGKQHKYIYCFHCFQLGLKEFLNTEMLKTGET